MTTSTSSSFPVSYCLYCGLPWSSVQAAVSELTQSAGRHVGRTSDCISPSPRSALCNDNTRPDITAYLQHVSVI